MASLILYKTTQRCPELIVTTTPLLTVTGPALIAFEPVGTVKDVATVVLFNKRPLLALNAGANAVPVVASWFTLRLDGYVTNTFTVPEKVTAVLELDEE
jgi:predicted polyphosphate/ATP-dependent NAD kinase